MRTSSFLYVLTALLIASVPAHAGEEARFTSVIDDLPLMTGIAEVGDGVEFSTPDGRIAEVTAQGRVARADVLAFYAATLPQLGWTRSNETTFVREDETLNLVFEPAEKTAGGTVGGGVRVRFALTPNKNKR